MIILVLLILIAIIIALVCYTSMNKRNNSEIEAVNNLKKRIDELDEDNVEVEKSNGTGKIIVPDVVVPDESTRKSTQKDECKEYNVGPKQKIEKTVIGADKKDEVFVNTEIERVEDEKDEGPIKENEGLVSKLLNKKDEE